MTQLTLVIGLVLTLLLSGCAPRSSVRNEMQADHSYRIEVIGAWASSAENLSGDAIRRAWALCPEGYGRVSHYFEDEYYPRYYLIVRCKQSEPPSAPQGVRSSGTSSPAQGKNDDGA